MWQYKLEYGDMVQHSKYGEGVIVEIFKHPHSAKIYVGNSDNLYMGYATVSLSNLRLKFFQTEEYPSDELIERNRLLSKIST